MNAHSSISPASADAAPRDNLAVRWAALQDAGTAVAVLAGIEPQPTSARVRSFPVQMRHIGGWRLELARRGVEDLDAIMRPGLSALLAVSARGMDATAAAQALWREFVDAREAMLALCPEDGAMGPRRSA